MCGIAGIVRKSSREGDEALARAMVERVAYRGPNGRCAVPAIGGAAFGHARLSIIDLHERSDQPFWSEDGAQCVVFNGEIYNYIELRKELQGLGQRFRTEGDTEVLLAAYRQWGDACWHRFNGMWAVAIWDVNEKTLLLSRDRYGVKPLHYAWTDDGLVFGSEIKEIIIGLGKTPAPRWEEVYRMFDRAPRQRRGTDTVFEGIHALPPGHELTFRPDSGERSLRQWYRLSPRTDVPDDPVRTFRELFIDAVRLRLRSDVPVGVCLSGGIDSSAIACVMARELGVTPRTFSSVYAEPDYSEERYMDAVVGLIGADAKKITPRREDFVPVMERIVAHHDEPIQMPGTYSQWHVMQLAGPHVRVLLDGQGGDETVGGYYSFHPAYARSLLLDIVRLREAGVRMRDFQELLRDQAKIGGSSRSLLRAMIPSLRVCESTAWKDRVFTPEFRVRMRQSSASDKTGSACVPRMPDALAREMYRQFADTNLPMLLKYEDRLSMAFSIESRVPFLDYRLAEFCYGLPYHWKMKGIATKWILREAFKDILPEAVTNRLDKKGFPTPLAVWMRGETGEEMKKRIEGAVNAGTGLEDVFDPAGVRRLFDEHANGTANHERILFRVFTTALWHEQWFSR